MLVTNTKYLPPYLVPTLPDLLLMDEPRRFPGGQGLMPEERGQDDWRLAEVHWGGDRKCPSRTSRYYLSYTSGIRKQPYPEKEWFRGYVLFEEIWVQGSTNWVEADSMWIVDCECQEWEPYEGKHNSALKLLWRDWEWKRDDCTEGHFSMIYGIHNKFVMNELREIARQIWY